MEYAKRSATPMNDTIDAMLRMTPPPCRTITGTAARLHRNTPLTFTRYRRSRSSSDVRSMLPTWAIPALLIRMSRRRVRATTRSNADVTAAASDTSHAAAPALPPLETIAAAVSVRRLAIDVEHLDMGPLPAEELGYCLPDARPATRDDGDLPTEFEHGIAGVEVLHIAAKVNDFCLLYR